jgi:hypothetical protein
MDEQHTPVTDVVDALAEKRAQQRLRHSAALIDLMIARSDLRGVHALADHFDEAIRWTA